MRRRRESGQAMVEFAMVLPVMLMILAAVGDVARIFIDEVRIANAARVGARYGVLHSFDFTAIEDKVYQELGQTARGAGTNQITSVTVTRVQDPNILPTTWKIQVTVVYNFSFITPIAFGVQILDLANVTQLGVM